MNFIFLKFFCDFFEIVCGFVNLFVNCVVFYCFECCLGCSVDLIGCICEVVKVIVYDFDNG